MAKHDKKQGVYRQNERHHADVMLSRKPLKNKPKKSTQKIPCKSQFVKKYIWNI